VSEPCCFCYYGSVVEFEVGYCDTTSIALFYSGLLLLFGDLLCFHMNFSIDFSISAKNDIEILMRVDTLLIV
jgi:hypothetical protein